MKSKGISTAKSLIQMKKYCSLLLFFFLLLSNIVMGQSIENDTTKLLTVVFDSMNFKHVLENHYIHRDFKLRGIEVINEKSYNPNKHKLVIAITKLKMRKHKAIIHGCDFNQKQTKSLKFILHATKKGDEWLFNIKNKKNSITFY